MTRLNSCFLLLALILPASVFAADKSLAPTPPMGWNSWDSYGRSINEQQVRATADSMAKNLKHYGWQYVVIDEGWYVTNPSADPKSYKFKISRDGFFLPDEDRFPSACNGAGLEVELQLVRLTPKELLTRRKLRTWRRDGIKSLPLRHSMSYRVSQDALSAFGAPPNSW
jgi:hypothetical protein